MLPKRIKKNLNTINQVTGQSLYCTDRIRILALLIGISMDFDSPPQGLILTKLHAHGFDRHSLKLIQSIKELK